jgi:hypothetical protein
MWILLAALLFHHATATEYDVSKTVTAKGKITHVEWGNPHIHVFMEVQAGPGSLQEWDVEFPAPGAAIVAGVSKQLLASGAVLTFDGFPGKPAFHRDPAKNSSLDEHFTPANHFACAKGAVLSDGSHVVFTVGI